MYTNMQNYKSYIIYTIIYSIHYYTFYTLLLLYYSMKDVILMSGMFTNAFNKTCVRQSSYT